jgi:hypothetical protein
MGESKTMSKDAWSGYEPSPEFKPGVKDWAGGGEEVTILSKGLLPTTPPPPEPEFKVVVYLKEDKPPFSYPPEFSVRERVQNIFQQGYAELNLNFYPLSMIWKIAIEKA